MSNRTETLARTDHLCCKTGKICESASTRPLAGTLLFAARPVHPEELPADSGEPER